MFLYPRDNLAHWLLRKHKMSFSVAYGKMLSFRSHDPGNFHSTPEKVEGLSGILTIRMSETDIVCVGRRT